MGRISLLDCTLRDGGYVNNWKFGHDNMVNIFERAAQAGVDIIEIGFLDESSAYDPDRSVMPDTESAGRIYGDLDKNGCMAVAMIDYGKCSLSNIRPCSDSFLDGIRVIFKKHLRRSALNFCSQLKALGYKVFAQLVSVTSYSDEEMKDLIRLANEAAPYAVSMVDTYGLMHQNNLMHYFDLLDEGLAPEIGLGYHAHNNFQMGYANCIAMTGRKTKRDLTVDGSMYGMGKSAGNAPTELIMMHMNHTLGCSYDVDRILEAIDTSILQFYRPASWGYSMFYFIAAYNDCHPDYVRYLMNKMTLSVSSVNDILKGLHGDARLIYDRELIEKLYISYQNNEVNDTEDMRRLDDDLGDREILLLGPGRTLVTQKDRIEGYLALHDPGDTVVVSVNMIPEAAEPDHVFITNSKRYLQLATILTKREFSVIATSNISGVRKNSFRYVLNYSNLIDNSAQIPDSSLIMFLRAIICMGKRRRVVLAGFDGYSGSEPNYYDPEKEYDFVKNKAGFLNSYTRHFLKEAGKSLDIEFLTDSRY